MRLHQSAIYSIVSVILPVTFSRRSFLAGWGGVLLGACSRRDKDELLHVSFDATREIVAAYSAHFLETRGAALGPALRVRASHGGSAKQTRSVVEGLSADVVSLAIPFDVETLVHSGHVAAEWADRLPFGASPFTSTIVLLARAGNPKSVAGLEDLLRPDVVPLTPNPKTSGGARWNHLALYGCLRDLHGESRALDLLGDFYAKVPALPSGARLALTAFVDRGIGDVLLAWESEALLAKKKWGDRLTVITPKRSIRAVIPVTVVDRVADRRGSRGPATAYVEGLFDDFAQSLAADNHLRPRSEQAFRAAAFPEIDLFDASDLGADWRDLHAAHFAEGGSFDRAFERASL
jgi:sulfate transport system substrate-binding protein